MKIEGKSAVVLLVLVTAANAAWIVFTPKPFGNSEFTGRILGIFVALLVIPVALAYWCAKGDSRGYSGSALYGVAMAGFMLANYQFLPETSAYNSYSQLILAAIALNGLLLAYVGYKGWKGNGKTGREQRGRS